MADKNDKHALERLIDEIVDCAVSVGMSEAMKGFGAFTECDSISMTAMRRSISQKRAQILGHFDETATQPADAALADLIAHMEHGAKLVDAIGALCCDGSPELNAADAIRKAAAALRARAVPEGKKYHDVAQRLYALLDDIDTAGDIAKSDDKLYRGIVERTQAKKRDFVVSCDGYTVTLADDSMLAASKEAP